MGRSYFSASIKLRNDFARARGVASKVEILDGAFAEGDLIR
jgi:hypothetical protein